MLRRLPLQALVGLLSVLAGCGETKSERPDVGPWSSLLITLDTTRADALSSFGGRSGITPNIDRLAGEGVRYVRAQTVAPLTLPSHASMLTGLYPPRHGVRDNGLAPLPESASTLAELARTGGFQTAAFIAAVVLDEAFGLAQGFETYVTPQRNSGNQQTSHFGELPAGDVIDNALAWYAGRDRTRPFFMWVHLFDAHGPYEPPPRFSSRAPTNPYLGEVAYTDHELERLLSAMRADGGMEETFVLLVADHGEAMGEHGESTHGAYCWQTTMHVPLIVRRPDGQGAGTTSESIVSVVDVHPTLADAMGLNLTANMDGVSLLRDAPAGRGVYFESFNGHLSYNWSPLSGWLDERGKYLHSSEPQFFEPSGDPQERHDLISEREVDAAHHLARIAELVSKPALQPAESIDDDNLTNDIQKLGYTAMGAAEAGIPSPLEVAGLPSPQSRVHEQMESLRALSLADAGKPELALPLLEALVAEYPTNWFAIDRLTNSLMALGRNIEAIPHLERLLSNGPQWAGSWFNLGLCYEEAERLDDAVNAYARAVELKSNQAIFLRKTIKLLRKLDREAETGPFRVKLRVLKRAGQDVVSPPNEGTDAK